MFSLVLNKVGGSSYTLKGFFAEHLCPSQIVFALPHFPATFLCEVNELVVMTEIHS